MEKSNSNDVRSLVQCPYCQDGEIGLDGNINLVFSPNRPSDAPCSHLVWLDGRFTEWAQSGGVDRVIGSTEFPWRHPQLEHVQDDPDLIAYVQELAAKGRDWEFAPDQTFEIASISADEKTTAADGKEHVTWEVDGLAVFALDAANLAPVLPEYRDRALAAFKNDS